MLPDSDEAQNEACAAPLNAEALAPRRIRRATTRTAKPMASCAI
jgi:hypothetical protein